MVALLGEVLNAFKPLQREAKVAIAAVFGWMLVFSLIGTIALVKVSEVASKRASEQRETATQAAVACKRSQVFGPPLLEFLDRAEAKLRTGTLSREITFEGKKTTVEKFYRATIPAHC